MFRDVSKNVKNYTVENFEFTDQETFNRRMPELLADWAGKNHYELYYYYYYFSLKSIAQQ